MKPSELSYDSNVKKSINKLLSITKLWYILSNKVMTKNHQTCQHFYTLKNISFERTTAKLIAFLTCYTSSVY